MATDMVSGVPMDTITAAKVVILEEHIHNKMKVFGSGITRDSLTGYSLTAGTSSGFGTETLLLDTGSTPVDVGETYFDLHRFAPVVISSATPYLIRLIYGTGTVAAGQYTTFGIYPTGTGSNVAASAVELTFPRLAAGTKVWAKIKNATNSATMTCLIGLHEY
jgi:hypothetical protein